MNGINYGTNYIVVLLFGPIRTCVKGIKKCLNSLKSTKIKLFECYTLKHFLISNKLKHRLKKA